MVVPSCIGRFENATSFIDHAFPLLNYFSSQPNVVFCPLILSCCQNIPLISDFLYILYSFSLLLSFLNKLEGTFLLSAITSKWLNQYVQFFKTIGIFKVLSKSNTHIKSTQITNVISTNFYKMDTICNQQPKNQEMKHHQS